MAKALPFAPPPPPVPPTPDTEDALVAQLNRTYSLIVEGGDACVLVSRPDALLGRVEHGRLKVGAFRTLLKHRRVVRGRRTISEADLWLEHPLRATYDRVLFDPDPAYTPMDGVLNLWRGFPLEAKAGKWTLIREHLFEIGACGDPDLYDFLLDWMAYLVQAPHCSPECAIVWQGAQGAGKGTLVKLLQALVGQHFLHVTHTRHFAGNFNGHLQDALVVFADEALWAGDKSAEGPLKQLITESHLIIERKGRDPLMARNYVHLVMATNNEWAVPMGLDDRRFCVIEVPDVHVDDRAYFTALHEELAHGGAEAFYWELLNRDLRKPRIPRTALSDGMAMKQKIHTMTTTERWWYAQLERGQLAGDTWPEQILCDTVHDAYLKDMDRVGHRSRRSTETELGMFLERVVPHLGRKRTREGLKRFRFWLFPPITECRAEFAKLLKTADLFARAVADEGEMDRPLWEDGPT